MPPRATSHDPPDIDNLAAMASRLAERIERHAASPAPPHVIAARLAGDRALASLMRFGLMEMKYSPDQPRVLGGQSGGGQWTRDSGDTAQDGGADAMLIPAFSQPAGDLLRGLIALFTGMSTQNSERGSAILRFDALEFVPGATAEDPAIAVNWLTRDKVDAACPRRGEVQGYTDAAAETVTRSGNYINAADYGNKVHYQLRETVRSMRDKDLVSEISLIKSAEADYYGQTNSIRVDVMERVGDGTVCVYDIKTGRCGLSVARMQEIANNAHSYWKDTRRLLLIEMRPRR